MSLQILQEKLEEEIQVLKKELRGAAEGAENSRSVGRSEQTRYPPGNGKTRTACVWTNPSNVADL
jgi:hypothetical protein